MNPLRHRCCQHNVAHGWPYFTENLWMATAGNGLAGVLYAREVKAKVGDGTEVPDHEDTLPVRRAVEFSALRRKQSRFLFEDSRLVRLCAVIAINGEQDSDNRPCRRRPGSARIQREWEEGRTTLVLTLPMKVKMSRSGARIAGSRWSTTVR